MCVPRMLTLKPIMPLTSAGSPFSPFSPFMPGRPCWINSTKMSIIPLLVSLPALWHHLQHPSITLTLSNTAQIGMQDVQMGWGDTVEEAMAKGTNKAGAGLTGLPGKPISPFIPARPWGPWKGRGDENAQSGGVPMGYEEDGGG